jgi:hypothetical protein
MDLRAALRVRSPVALVHAEPGLLVLVHDPPAVGILADGGHQLPPHQVAPIASLRRRSRKRRVQSPPGPAPRRPTIQWRFTTAKARTKLSNRYAVVYKN